ncbi:MAG TPA: phospholipase D-like domain-containing protein [Solirubrobacteraceae bacterium]|nr:phospholipase D-like domain-containing protein [Solirubrobacteraceae bacterium]
MNKRWPAAIAVGAAAWYSSDSLRHRREQGQGYELRGKDIEVGSEEFLRATEAITMAPITHGNEIELFINGDAIFPAMIETMRAAQRTLNFLSYLYWTGEIGSEIAGVLCDRAQAGVEVNVLLDAVGSAKMDRSLIKRMGEAGVTFAYFRPPKPYAMRRLNNRTHRKLLIADGEVGMTGGVGIADQWTGDAQDPEHWRDTHVRVRGPIVRGLQGAFAENWLEATGDVLVGEKYLPALAPILVRGNDPMQVVRSTATVGDTNIEALYFLAIECARTTLHLTSAYFAPRPAFSKALADAAKRGVDVRVLVPGRHTDKEFVRQAGRAVYEELLEAGVQIFEFSPTMIHAKTLTIDGVWASVGSVNFDNRSFQLQDEVTLCVCSREFAGQLDEQFERDLERSNEIDLERWNGRVAGARVKESLTKLARREL